MNNIEEFAFHCRVVVDASYRCVRPDALLTAFHRFLKHQWGEVNDAEYLANRQALTCGGKLISRYRDSLGVRFLFEAEVAQGSYQSFMLSCVD